MARVCEICGRKQEEPEEKHNFDILDICPDCSDDRIQGSADSTLY